MTARRACATAREIPKNRQSKASSRQDKRKANSRRDKSIEDLEEVGKDSKSDRVMESVAKSKAETMPKSATKATTKPKAQPTSTPKLFRGGRTRGDWEVSNRVGRKMMEADVQGVSQATTVAVALQNTMAVGDTPASVCSGGAAET